MIPWKKVCDLKVRNGAEGVIDQLAIYIRNVYLEIDYSDNQKTLSDSNYDFKLSNEQKEGKN